jgi:hypothetical protein
MAQAVRRWFETGQAFGFKNSPTLILHNLLQKEETHVYERGPDVAWEPFKIDRNNTAEVRQEAISLLKEFALAVGSDSAVEAVHELGAALSVPVRCFPSDETIDKYVQWQSEHLQVLDALDQIIRNSSSKLVSLEAERKIRSHLPYIRSKETLKRCQEILEGAANDLETRLTKAIISGLFEGISTNWRREEKKTHKSYQDLAFDIIRELTPQQTVDKINAILNECQEKKRNTNAQHFLVILCQSDSEYAWAMCEILLAAPFNLLKWHIPALLSPLRKVAPEKARTAINGLFTGDLQSKQILSYAFASWDWLESRIDFEVEIFRALCREADGDIKRWSAHSLIRMALHGHPKVAQIVLKDLLPGSDPSVPAEIYAMFDDKHGYDPAGLSNEDLLELVRRLENVPKIDEYGIVGFLSMALRRIPEAVVELFLLRIEAHAQNKLTVQPIPYHLFDEASDHFNHCNDIKGLCLMVATAAKTFDGGFDHYAILFREVSCNFGSAGRNVLLALGAQSLEDFALMCRLLKSAPRHLLFDDHAFIKQLIEFAEKFGTDHVDLLCRSVVIVATAGVRERAHGKPAESDEELQAEALKIAALYAPGTVMNELYSVISGQASRNIESDLQWDEEHDYA